MTRGREKPLAAVMPQNACLSTLFLERTRLGWREPGLEEREGQVKDL